MEASLKRGDQFQIRGKPWKILIIRTHGKYCQLLLREGEKIIPSLRWIKIQKEEVAGNHPFIENHIINCEKCLEEGK